MRFFTMDDFNFKNKTILLRVDINSHFDPEKGLTKTPRIKAHAKTIKELIEKQAKVVILAHQGRKGEKDFIHLDRHAKLLSEEVGQEIKFINDIIGEKAVKAVKALNPGEALLLDNVRFLEDETAKKSIEEHANSKIVKALSPLADYFILDGFSVAHRSHASVVGFTTRLPSIAGRVLEGEVTALSKALMPLPDGFDIIGPTMILPDLPRLSLKWKIFVLAGAKVDDCVDVMEHLTKERFKKIEKILLGGLLANLFLLAAGIDIGEASKSILEKKGYLELLPKAKELLKQKQPEIMLPIDVAFEKEGKRAEAASFPVDGVIKDIGSETIKEYERIISDAESIVLKGPVGVYEDERFAYGTRRVLEAVAYAKGFSLVGGGDTSTAIETLGIEKEKFSYISLAGGAFIAFLSGKELPGLKALEISYKRFISKKQRKKPVE